MSLEVKRIIPSIENKYLNVIINPDKNTIPRLSDAKFAEDLTIPILDNPSDWYCSIVRFMCPLDTIPDIIFPLDIFQNNANVSFLTIGIKTALNAYFPERVIYVPTNPNISAPIAGGSSPFFTDEQASSEYYFIYSITAFLNMINTALSTAVTASGIGVATPFFTFDPMTQLFSLNVSAAFIATGAEIFINEYTLNYLRSFNYRYNQVNHIPDSNGADYTFIMPTGAGPFVIVEDYISLPLWFELRKILIVSNSIPIIKEIVPSGSGLTGVTSGLNIITDFAISFDTSSQIDTVAIYNPSAQYRLVNMISNSPLVKTDFQFYWESKQGEVYPLKLSPMQQASLKIGFFKKNLYLK